MTAVIAVLSFIMAFGAIWFTSEALKRVDNFNTARMKPHIGKVYRAIDGVNETILSLQGRMERLEKQVRVLQLNTELPPAIERETMALQADLGETPKFVPYINLNG